MKKVAMIAILGMGVGVTALASNAGASWSPHGTTYGTNPATGAPYAHGVTYTGDNNIKSNLTAKCTVYNPDGTTSSTAKASANDIQVSSDTVTSNSYWASNTKFVTTHTYSDSTHGSNSWTSSVSW
jgi:hypothetical protein